MSVVSWRDLEQLFTVEITEWGIQYPNKQFVDRIIKLCFNYYDKPARQENKPTDKDSWKRAVEFFLKNNWEKENMSGYGNKKPFEPKRINYTFEPRTEVELKCDYCLDLRVVRAIAKDLSYETLMLCECVDRHADKSDWELPQWDDGMSAIYMKERCPLAWFKPQQVPEDGDSPIWRNEAVNEKIKQWLSRVHRAEKFWKDKFKEIEAMTPF